MVLIVFSTVTYDQTKANRSIFKGACLFPPYTYLFLVHWPVGETKDNYVDCLINFRHLR